MAKLSDLKRSATHRVLIFGGPKTGKSLLAGKLAEKYKLIWIDLENGHDVLFQLPEAWQENIELVNIPDTRSYPIAIETCLKMVKGKVDICEAHGKVACMICKKNAAPSITLDLPNLTHDTVVVFDSLTQLSNSAIAHITRTEPEDYKLNYDDWGNLGKLLEIFLSHIQQAGYNVIVISHECEAETEGKKKTLVPVGGTRNFSRNIAKYFDHVVYAEMRMKKHVFASATNYSSTIQTGSRTGVSLEAAGQDASLLQIFMPELYANASSLPSSVPNTILPNANTGVAKGTSVDKPKGNANLNSADILNRLRNK
jgi:hypothetical protein